MIACDNHFLSDESMLKAMLRVFEKRIAWTLRLRSISWVVSLLSFRREARDVCVCVCVCWCFCAWEKEMRMKSVAFEKNLSSVEFKDFCLLKSILELIIRSFVNIKRKRRNLFRWQKLKIQIYICTSNYRKFTLFVIILDQISDYSILF
jgi:hypothetical protein